MIYTGSAWYVPIYGITVYNAYSVPLSSASVVFVPSPLSPLMLKLQALSITHPQIASSPRPATLTKWLCLKYFSPPFFLPASPRPLSRSHFRAVGGDRMQICPRPLASVLLLIDWSPLTSRHWCIRAINFIQAMPRLFASRWYKSVSPRETDDRVYNPYYGGEDALFTLSRL